MDELGAKKLVYFYYFTRKNKGYNFGNNLQSTQFNMYFNKICINMVPDRKIIVNVSDVRNQHIKKKFV